MSDFFQNGIVTSLHELGQRPAADLMAEVERYASERPITLVLPCLYAELQGPALDPIVRGLAELPWLAEIVIGLDQADEEGYRHARRYFSRLPQPHHVIWNDGPRVQALVADLAAQRLAPADRGKGHNIWMCMGLAQATGVGQVVALHDCDVLTFEARSLARLVYPVIHPTANFVFAKAYYPRISEAGLLYGRVSRLFVTPLLRALMRCLPPSRYLDFLNSFRYPLAGECALRMEAAHRLHLPSDWGLEIGILTEVFRDHSTRQLCQVAIAERYDHKHQPLEPAAADRGLARMGRDIAFSLFNGLASQGQVLDLGLVRTVVSAYQRIVLDLLDSYAADAAINGLSIDRGAESLAVDCFTNSLFEAGQHFVQENSHRPLTPTWDEVLRLQPDALERLRAAVSEDRTTA